MREWFNRQTWKVCVSEMVPRVRIPLSPPLTGSTRRVAYKGSKIKLNNKKISLF
jgi:hypothetical protein